MQKNVLNVAAVGLLIVGCASANVNQDDLEKRTSLALGLRQGTFAIHDRAVSGTRVDYVVKQGSAVVARCYVESIQSLFSLVQGPQVSDAVCSRQDGVPSRNPLTKR